MQLMLAAEAHIGRHRRPARRIVAIGGPCTLVGGRLPPRTLIGGRLVGEGRLPPRPMVGGRLPPRALERQLPTNDAAVHACNVGGRGVGVGEGERLEGRHIEGGQKGWVDGWASGWGSGWGGGWLARGGSVTTGPRVPRAEHAGASRCKCLHLAKSSPPPIASS